jgi:uncharacterized repeat protein (TIGR03803 family)
MRSMMQCSILATLLGAVIVAAPAAKAGGYRQEYRFRGGADGAAPTSRLVKVGGQLYGTTPSGGDAEEGTIFSFDPSTGAKTIVYSFKGPPDASSPGGELIDVGGKLYGTAGGGGGDCNGGCGTVFSFDPSSKAEAVVHAFQGGSDSEEPIGLLNIGQTLFGTTAGYNNGTVYSIDLASGTEQTLHVFRGGADGRQPTGLVHMGGALYGMALYGGSTNCEGEGCGVVFKVDLSSGHEDVVYAFSGGRDGASPSSGDMIEVSGILYGTTSRGGGRGPISDGSGTIFSIDPVTGKETVLHRFQGGSDGIAPAGGLTAFGETLYGVTFRGGGGDAGPCQHIGCGTVFSLSLTTGMEQIAHVFSGSRAGFPAAALAKFSDRLFGATVFGGDMSCHQGCGTLFSVRP